MSAAAAASAPHAFSGAAIAAPVSDLLPDLVALRHDLHAHPELAFEERRTAGIMARALRLLGLTVHESVGGTGVVGTLHCGPGESKHSGTGKDMPSVGLRADMDALPMVELGQRAHASRSPGKHHGCGHDGHTGPQSICYVCAQGWRYVDATTHTLRTVSSVFHVPV